MIQAAIILPAMLAVRRSDMIYGVFLCYALGAILNVFFVFNNDPSRVYLLNGYPGYFMGKNYLGEFAAVVFILALHEAVHRGELPADVARERLRHIAGMPIRLLGDAVLRRRAWELADQLGLDLRRRVHRANAAAGRRVHHAERGARAQRRGDRHGRNARRLAPVSGCRVGRQARAARAARGPVRRRGC